MAKRKRRIKTKFDSGGKIINETKIVEIPTPDTSSFVARRVTLGGPGAALKRTISVLPFVGSKLKKGKNN